MGTDYYFNPPPIVITPSLVLRRLAELSEEDRVEFIGKLKDGFCEHCGREQEAKKCQCWNDE